MAAANESSHPPAGRSAAEVDGSILHLALWKPKRAASWTTPRFSPSICLILVCIVHLPCMMMREPGAREMPTVASRDIRHMCRQLTAAAPRRPFRYNARVDEFVDAGPSRRRACHPQPRGRAPRARTTPQRPSCAPPTTHSHPVACRCSGAQLLNFERGASDFNFILVLAAGRHPHLYQHHQR
jgi:hypothetical protein